MMQFVFNMMLKNGESEGVLLSSSPANNTG